MSFAWLKQYMPRGIYGRAALILVLPVVTMLLVVSVVFIQRHFEDVTLQMTDSLAAELNLVLSDMQAEETQVDALARVAKLSEALDIRAEFSLNETPEDQRRWFDFSGLVVARVLKRDLPINDPDVLDSIDVLASETVRRSGKPFTDECLLC